MERPECASGSWLLGSLMRTIRSLLPVRRRVSGPPAGYSGLNLDPGSDRLPCDRQPNASMRAACRSLGRLNDRAVHALCALTLYGLSWRIGFLELGSRFQGACDTQTAFLRAI